MPAAPSPRSERAWAAVQPLLRMASALVEARSCERFLLLAEGAERQSSWREEDRVEFSGLFRRFADSEAGHAVLFTGLAMRHGEAVASARLVELRELEAGIVERLPTLPRIH